MTREEQAQSFINDLDRLVNRYRHEFELTYSDVIAALELKKLALADELRQMPRPPITGGGQ